MKNSLRELDATGGVKQTPLHGDDRLRHLVDELGMREEVVRRLDESVAIKSGRVEGVASGGSEGIGYMVNYGGQTFQTDTVFLGVAIIALAGITLTWLAEQLEKRFSRWRPER